ncbi:MAG: oleandomycin glycosyltransferase [Deltaproteobacteria bacterium]|nr:oleandomycin glycosyltransferase [Deltaproteobacteria bacterium]
MPTLAVLQMPAHGHINPTLPVLAELVRRGDRVIAWASPDMREKLASTGAEFREYPPFPFDHDAPPKNLGEVADGLLQFAIDAAPALVADARSERVDYVMHDSMAPWGRAVAASLRVPSVCSTSTFAIGAGVPRSLKYLLVKLLIYAQSARSLPSIWANARRLSARHPISPPRFFELFRNRADLNLVYTSALFQPLADQLDDTYRFCGPSIPELPDTSDPIAATDPALSDELGDRPLVYASLGTLFNDRADFFRVVLEGLSDFDGRVLLSIGRKIDPKQLGPLPANAVIRPFVPQLAVLRRASLFLTHGGMNSVSEGLYFGVPQLVYPQAADQMTVADRVAEVGAGLVMKERDLEPRRLRSLVRTILERPSFAKNAARIGASLRAAGGYREAVAQIEQLKRRFGI